MLRLLMDVELDRSFLHIYQSQRISQLLFLKSTRRGVKSAQLKSELTEDSIFSMSSQREQGAAAD